MTSTKSSRTVLTGLALALLGAGTLLVGCSKEESDDPVIVVQGGGSPGTGGSTAGGSSNGGGSREAVTPHLQSHVHRKVVTVKSPLCAIGTSVVDSYARGAFGAALTRA